VPRLRQEIVPRSDLQAVLVDPRNRLVERVRRRGLAPALDKGWPAIARHSFQPIGPA
jgi:hypothetical protein